jgi:hypothetical protein
MRSRWQLGGVVGSAVALASAAVVGVATAATTPSGAAASAIITPSIGIATHHLTGDARHRRSSAVPTTGRTVVDPPGNTAATQAFLRACLTTPVRAAACDGPALTDFATARAAEGLGPMTLPAGFDALPAATQLFVLANIDRVDHGLSPVSAMSDSIDALAATGAQQDADPDFPDPFTGTGGGSNWAGAGSALLSEFLWVYDDGPVPGTSTAA